MEVAGFGGPVRNGVNRGSRCGGGHDVDDTNSSVAAKASTGRCSRGELGAAPRRRKRKGAQVLEERKGGRGRGPTWWRVEEVGGGSGQCMVQQEEWGSSRRQMRGRDECGIRSVRQGTAARGPAGRIGGGAWPAAAVRSVHKNSNLFDLFKGNSKRGELIRLKDGLYELKFFQIKYVFIGNQTRNNFIHRNFSRFEMDFKIKFWESKV
jgi:hypothetical protein